MEKPQNRASILKLQNINHKNNNNKKNNKNNNNKVLPYLHQKEAKFTLQVK